MTKLYNIQTQKQLRRNLRKQEITAEKLLWWKLRNKNLGFKFRRQFGIGKYIVDFYCPKLKLVIEIDGSTHSSEIEIINDKKRQDYLVKLGLIVKRYTNTDIKENINEVLVDIYQICNKIKA